MAYSERQAEIDCGRTGDGYAALLAFHRFSNSKYGQWQERSQVLRYSKKYGYEPDRQMLEDLGDDIHPVRHMEYTTFEIASPFMEEQLRLADSSYDFTVDEVRNFLVASALHDIGECEHIKIKQELGFIVGDVLYGEKSVDDEDKEKKVRSFLYQELYPHFTDDRLDAIESVIEFSPDDTLSNMFNVIERLGYLKTAVQAGSVALSLSSVEHQPEQAERALQLTRLANDVMYPHLAYVENRSDDYPYIAKTLETMQTDIEGIRSGLAVPAQKQVANKA